MVGHVRLIYILVGGDYKCAFNDYLIRIESLLSMGYDLVESNLILSFMSGRTYTITASDGRKIKFRRWEGGPQGSGLTGFLFNGMSVGDRTINRLEDAKKGPCKISFVDDYITPVLVTRASCICGCAFLL